MNNVDFIAQGILSLTHEYFILIFVSIGYFSKNRPIFTRVLFILLFSIILNCWLKSVWKIPLAEHLGKEGWAFPSGHMQNSIVFWGWLAWELNKSWVYILAVTFLIGIATSLMHFGYHTSIDIIGAFVFALPTLFLYQILIKMPKITTEKIGLVLTLLSLPLVYLIHNIQPYSIPLGALIGFTLGCSLEKSYSDLHDSKPNLKNNLFLNLIFAVLGILIIYQLSTYLYLFFTKDTGNFIKFFSVALWISYGANATAMLFNKIKNGIKQHA